MKSRLSIILAAMLLGTTFAAASILPLFFQRFEKEFPYQGVSIMGPDAETYYAARVREVYDGDPTAASAFYGGSKDVPFLQPPLPEMAIAYPAQILGVSPVTMLQISRVFWGFVVAVLFFLFVLAVTGDDVSSFVAASMTLFAGAILAAPWLLPHYFDPASHGFEFLRFSRVINPQWTVSWFLIMFLCVASWLRHSENRTRARLPDGQGGVRLLVGAAIAVVILIYSYVYAWTLALATMGLLTLWFLLKRDWKRIKDLAVFWVIALIGLIPYFMHLQATMNHPWYPTSAKRMGLIFSHEPILGAWSVVFVAVAFLSKKRWPATWPLLPALSLAAIIALNQHVITGNFIVPHHYHWYFIQPLASLFAVALFLSYRRVHDFFDGGLWLTAALFLGPLAIAIIQQFGAYQGARGLWGRLQPLAPVLTYIRDHAEAGDTVYAADDDILNMIPIYTSADVYTSTNAMNVMADPSRPQNVYYFKLWLEGMTPDIAEQELFTSRRIELSQKVYAIHYRELLGAYDRIPDEVVEENIRNYRKFYALSMQEKLALYPLTLLITSPGDPKTPEWNGLLFCSKKVFSADSYQVFRLLQPVNCK